MDELMPFDLVYAASRFMPTFVLHTSEMYFPCDMESYLEACDLVDGESKAAVMAGPLTNHSLEEGVDGRHLNAPDRRYNLAIRGGGDNPIIKGCRTEDLDMDVPILVYGSRVRSSGHVLVHFVPFYAYNGPTAVLGGTLWMGEHEADIEHVTAELLPGDDDSYELLGCYLSRHGAEMYYRADVLEGDEGRQDHKRVYVARGSHAHYPTAGAHARMYRCAYDVTDDGVSWRPRRVTPVYPTGSPHYDASTMGFMRVRGYMGGGYGRGGVSNLCLKAWYTHGLESGVDSEYLTDDRLVGAGRRVRENAHRK